MSRTTIGIDLGGTKISTAVLRDGALVDVRTLPTETGSEDALVRQIADQARAARERVPEVAGLGVGVPCVVDFATGVSRHAVNLPLDGVPLRSVLEDRLGLPVFVDNDATCAAFAEAHEDGRLVHRHLVMFTLGTGVGGGLVLDGRVYRGATGGAGELGHTVVGLGLDDGVPPVEGDFPRPGSLERLAAGRALDRLAVATAEKRRTSSLANLLAAGRSVRGPDAVTAATEGDEAAGEAVRVFAERIGIGIANAINTFDPEVVAIGGGASRAGDLLLGPATEVAARFTLPGVGTRTTIRLARHGVEAGLLGAALMARDELATEEGRRRR